MSEDNSDSCYHDWDRKNAIAAYKSRVADNDDKMEQMKKRLEMLYIGLHRKQKQLEDLKKLYTKDDIRRISENYIAKKKELLEEQVRFRQFQREHTEKYPALKFPCTLVEPGEDAAAGETDEGKPQE